jgi:serine/threonine-protein kinase ULK/ATG1
MMAETLCGSPLYMAPEILRYEKYDAKADLWSVGAVLYEMSVGKAPFRAQNHIELLKRIENSKGVKFPDEDPSSLAGKNGGGGSADLPVPNDIKLLVRVLLKRNPAERASFEEFFSSTALAKSKFPRPQDSLPEPLGSSSTAWNGRPSTPEHHRIIPPEVLDPTAMIPPSKFNFRGNGSPLSANAALPRIIAVGSSTSGGMILSPEVLDPTAMIPPSKFNFRGNGSPLSANAALPRESSQDRAPVDAPKRKSLVAARQGGKRLSTEGSLIPGETEEDGNLRREYVLVGDTRAVEFNKAVDGTIQPLFFRRLLLIFYCRNICTTPTTFAGPKSTFHI